MMRGSECGGGGGSGSSVRMPDAGGRVAIVVLGREPIGKLRQEEAARTFVVAFVYFSGTWHTPA